MVYFLQPKNPVFSNIKEEAKMENQFFKAIPLMEGVTAIAGLGGEYAYLV